MEQEAEARKQMELLDQQKEALGFEQVRLLNKEKEDEMLIKAQQQNQMIEAEKQAKENENLIQFQHQAMLEFERWEENNQREVGHEIPGMGNNPPSSGPPSMMPPPPPPSSHSSPSMPIQSQNTSMPPPRMVLHPSQIPGNPPPNMPPPHQHPNMPPPHQGMPPPPPFQNLPPPPNQNMPPPHQSMPPPPSHPNMPPPPHQGMPPPPPPPNQNMPPPSSNQNMPPPPLPNQNMPPPPMHGQNMPYQHNKVMPPPPSMHPNMPPPHTAMPLPPPNQSMPPPSPVMPPPNQNMPPVNQSMPPPPSGQAGPPMQQSMPPPTSQSGEANKPPALMSLNVPKPREEAPKDIALPHALEKALAFKDERAQQLGVNPDDVQPIMVEEEKQEVPQSQPKPLVPIDDDEEEGDIVSKESKNKKRKNKKKQRKARQQKRLQQQQQEENKKKETGSGKSKKEDVEIEYVQEEFQPTDPAYFQFVRIFEKFRLQETEKPKDISILDQPSGEGQKPVSRLIERKKPADIDEEDEELEAHREEEKAKLSKKKMKKLTRMSIAELKQRVARPDLVEMHDVTAKDPVLLLQLKSARNTVPVPRHWCFKRKYLQGKRGIEKPPFQLPDFIKKTGIMEMRQALQEKEDQKTLKSKMRERVRPKLGKIDIDYQKLHDAFFKWQTKPKLTIHGDLYYEGKEFETRLKEKKPGDLSEELRVALGMPTGPNAHKCPPPWLIAMQRYGPPPSYPNLKIPGLNAPIPEGCSFGYHAGGWGKPPVDEMGRPLYGDVFGIQVAENQANIIEEDFDRTLWGEMESESSEEEEDEDFEEGEKDETGLVTPAEGLVTPSGFSSIPAGMETPDMIELRKRKIEAEMEGGETPAALYQVLAEKKVDKVGNAMMASTHIYDIAGGKQKVTTTYVPNQGVEVALDPSELEMDSAQMAARYEQTVREQQSQLEKEDLSDMVAEHAARQKNKRKRQQQDGGNKVKKYKDFKF